MQTGQGPCWRWLMAVAVVLGAGQQTHGQEVTPWATLEGHTTYVVSLAFTPDGRMLASGSFDGTAKLWEVASGRLRATLQKHTKGVTSVAFAPGRGWLATCGQDRTAKVWTLAGRCLHTFPVAGSFAYAVAFSPSGELLAVGGGDPPRWWPRMGKPAPLPPGDLRLCDARTGAVRHVMRGQFPCVASAAFSPDGRTLATGDFGGGLVLWEVASGKVRATLRGVASEKELASLRGAGWIVYAVTFAAGGRLLVSGGRDGAVRVWDVATGRERVTLRGHAGSVVSVASAHDGKLLASVSMNNGHIRLWDAATGKALLIMKQCGEVVAFSPDGKLLAVGDKDGTIRLWSVPKLLAHKGKK